MNQRTPWTWTTNNHASSRGDTAIIQFAWSQLALTVMEKDDRTLTLVNKNGEVYTAVKDERGVYVYLGKYEVSE